MPYGDRTGPAGQGPRTGRGLGFCNGFDAPGAWSGGRGMGWARGRGRGRGFGMHRGFVWGVGPGGFFPVTPGWPGRDEETEKTMLSQEIAMLQNRLQALNERLEKLEKPGKPEDKA